MMNKVNITDIARKSGVSVSTVSLVLNNKPGVSQETRSRVLQVSNDLGYLTKPSSRQGRIETLSAIGMVVKMDPDALPQANPFYSKVILGIEDACRGKGIDLLFSTQAVDEDNRPLDVPQLLLNTNVGGLLMVGICLDEHYTSIIGNYRVPVVLVDGYSYPEGFDRVVSDNFQAAYQMVEYLIGRGHRHIGLVGGDRECYPSLRERRNGYLRALKENGISDHYIVNFNVNQSKGYEETISLIEAHPQISALFCINDDIGSSALRAVQSLGKQVPEEISITGYDDTYLASNTHPALTTMHVDTVAMGHAAVQLLSLRLEYPNSARMTLNIHPKLIERESVSTAPA